MCNQKQLKYLDKDIQILDCKYCKSIGIDNYYF